MPETYLSVIIPAYNEEKRLPKTLKEIDGYLQNQNYNYEIIVVNNGSKDKTAEVVKNLTGEIKNLKLTDNKENRGKGFAVRQGMLGAKGDYRAFTDADNSTPISELEKILPEFRKGYDVVIGSRDAEGAVLDPPQPWQRRLSGEVFKLFRKTVLNLWGIEDTQCGFKGFTKRAAEDIFPKCKIEGFSFDPEVLLIAKKLGYKIKEIGIYWKNDLESKVKLKSVINMAIDLLKIRINLITKVYD
jgi:dolichyl-phosphate beta-glucosyltransferase